MPRVKNPLPEYTDSEILRLAAASANARANRAGEPPMRELHRGMAARLRAIARRVPLWTDRQEAGR